MAEPVSGHDGHGFTPMHAPVLVLTASYEPINVCAARRAIVLVLKGVAMTEEENGHFLHSARFTIRVPSVIRLLEYRRIPHQTRALSRKNILLRDRSSCQYCGEELPSGELTLDHVVPRSRGGRTTWENVVTACSDCNLLKGNRLPLESGMYPRHLPRQPTTHLLRDNGRAFPPNFLHQSWRDFLYWDTVLEPS